MSACSSACRCGHVTPPAPFRKFHVTILKSDRLHDVLVGVRIVTTRGHSRGGLRLRRRATSNGIETATIAPTCGHQVGPAPGPCESRAESLRAE